MDIRGKKVLVLGGWGLVGSAIARKLVAEEPKSIVLTSLLEWQTRDAVRQMEVEFPDSAVEIAGEWGDIFQRAAYQGLSREEILGDPDRRRIVLRDLLGEFNQTILTESMLYQVLTRHRPEVIIDCINSATSFAYQDIFKSSLEVHDMLDDPKHGAGTPQLKEAVERLLCTSYTPQLIRHVQILYHSMVAAGTKIYVKIGTSGTGGMGLNIPYTHSEERPSRVLLSKSAVAGAHTMLLFLMARTPDGPIIKEFKPTALIAWKKIEFGKIYKRGAAVRLFDMEPGMAVPLEGSLSPGLDEKLKSYFDQQNPPDLESVFIDTGENGIFSPSEFEAVTMVGQMQFITPEEIARSVIFEVRGGNTGHDVINALDEACLGPTYRAGTLRASVLHKMRELETKHAVRSVAFEMLGPPKLSKILWEAELLRRIEGNIEKLAALDSDQTSRRTTELISLDQDLRRRILAIGIPILLPDGRNLLRGPEMKIPVFRGRTPLPLTQESIDHWADEGWVDLRRSNMQRWKERLERILAEVAAIPANDTSSHYDRDRDFWKADAELDVGKVAGWIFINEDKGSRMK